MITRSGRFFSSIVIQENSDYHKLMNNMKKIVDFIHYAEKLKVELRHATKSDKQKESVADHSWRLSLFLVLVLSKLSIKIDELKTIKMAIIHDIIEIDARDIPLLDQIKDPELQKQKHKNEKKAIEKIKKMLGEDGKEIAKLWQEYEDQKTNEAKVVMALDKLEGELQFIQDPVRKFLKDDQVAINKLFIQTTKLCKIDPALQELDRITMAQRRKRTSH